MTPLPPPGGTSNRPRPIGIGNVTLPAGFPLNQLDLPQLRVAFSRLFDLAAEKVNGAGLDLDDVVFNRRAICTTGENRAEVPVETLVDLDRLTRRICDAMGVPASAAASVFVETFVVAILRDGDSAG